MLNLLSCRQFSKAHHRAYWTQFETCLDARCFMVVPFICIFGLVRLFLFNHGTGFSSDDSIIVGLNCALLIHRIGWVPLLALGLKYPKLCRFYHCYEMLAMILDSVLSLSNTKTPAAHNFTILYLLLMKMLVYSAFCYDLRINLSTVILHILAVGTMWICTHDTENLPAAYQLSAAIVVDIIMVFIVHLTITRIGFWYVETLVKMESQLRLLDSVDDCVVLVVEQESHDVVFVN